MANATAEVNRRRYGERERHVPGKLAPGQKVFRGQLVFIRPSNGRLYSQVSGAAIDGERVYGLAIKTVDNTDGSDPVDITVSRSVYAMSGNIAQAGVDALVYATDNQTVALIGDVPAGRLLFIDEHGLWVDLDDRNATPHPDA